MWTPGQEEGKNPGDSSVLMNLKVKDQDGNEIYFRIKRNTQLKILMNAYCAKKLEDPNYFTFLFDGRRIFGEQTPDELGMEDGDEIDFMQRQIGGAQCLIEDGVLIDLRILHVPRFFLALCFEIKFYF